MRVVHQRVAAAQRVLRLDGVPRAVLRQQIAGRDGHQGQRDGGGEYRDEDGSEPEPAGMENGQRQDGEREKLDGRAERAAHGRADGPASLERNEREDHQRRHERVALAVLQCQEHLEVQECERDGRLALREESVQRVPQQQPVEQSPAQKRERERQIGEGR